MILDICAVDTNRVEVYDFLRDDETEEELLLRAKDYGKRNDLGEEFKVMSYLEYKGLLREKMISLPLSECTTEVFETMLNILPPKYWRFERGMETFCMSEHYFGSWTNQYARIGDKCYVKLVDVTDRSTWIHNFIPDTIQA